MNLPDFAKLVREMRMAQKAYFRRQTPEGLETAKSLERRVDAVLIVLLDPQGKLFDQEGGDPRGKKCKPKGGKSKSGWQDDLRRFGEYWGRRVLKGEVSPLDRLEWMAIEIHARWLYEIANRSTKECTHGDQVAGGGD